VGHIDHKDRPDLVSDFPHPAEIDFPGIGRVAGQKNEGPDFQGFFLYIIIV
jgi:hypothetical protein